MDRLRRLAPILVWLPRYRRADLPGDLTAGLTTAVMLIPQAMAYAMLAGLPPIVGLYAAIAPPLVYALFGSSPKLAVGPVAMDSLLVAAALSSVTLAAGETLVVAAAALAVMVGAMQLAMGALRLGFVVNFLSRPVLSGFTSAAAVVIAASQLGAMLGVKLSASTGIHTILGELWAARAAIHLPTLLVGLAAIDLALPQLLHRLRPRELVTLGVTFVATLTLGITTGLALGVLLSLALFILRTTRPHTAELGRLPGTTVYRNRHRFADALPVPGVVLLRLDAQLYFANAAFLRETLLRQIDAAATPVRAVVLDASAIHDVDISALATLRELHRTLAARDIDLHFASVTGPVRDIFARSKFQAELGPERFSFATHEAVQRALGEPLPHAPRVLQADP